MTMTAVSAENLPIIDITEENCAEQWTNIQNAIRSSTFIALDIEMSGLGNRKKLTLQSIEERYKTICELASTYSILSLGISCFDISSESLESDDNVIKVTNQTYNVLTLNTEEFLVEPSSLKFLINHGFDFNKQFKTGLTYYKGNDKIDIENISNNSNKYSARDLITEISLAQCPIVLHNAFIDLIFIYQNFYAKCPGSSLKFLADLEEIFAGGVYDTKYIADFHAHSSASYLQYLYKKALYENCQMKANEKRKHVFLEFSLNQSYLKNFKLDSSVLKSLEAINTEIIICTTYSVYGYCPKIETCTKSHDINLIIQTELMNQHKKRNKSKNKIQQATKTEAPIESEKETESEVTNMPHSAGLDAFMTGYVMLNYINRFTKFTTSDRDIQNKKVLFSDINELETKFRNNVSLAGKDYPLVVSKGNFTSISIGHKDKKERLLKLKK